MKQPSGWLRRHSLCTTYQEPNQTGANMAKKHNKEGGSSNSTRPLSARSTAVLRAIQEGTVYGFDIMDATGLPSGTVYPVLGRLTKAGCLASKWERSSVAHREKRPPRRYYEITPKGTTRLADSMAHYAALARGFAPATPERSGA